MAKFETLVYPGTDEHGPYRVEELAPSDVIAQECMRIQAAAYNAQFEANSHYPHSLPLGSSAGQFNVYDSSSVSARRERMQQYVAAGHIYLGARASDGASNVAADCTREQPLAGFIKVGPSKTSLLQKINIVSPHLFVNDIIVKPACQGAGIGSTLLHAAVGFAGYDPRRKLALHAFEGSSANDWFAALGLKPRPNVSVEPVEIGGNQLPQELYVTEDGLTIGGLRHKLEQQRPELSRVTYLTA